jgi:ParB family chromosome partitioning protein
MPDEVAAECERLSGEIDEINAGAYAFAADDIARAGAFVTVGHDGTARIERGFIRPADEPSKPKRDGTHHPDDGDAEIGETDADQDENNSDDGAGMSDRLVTDLTTHRTAALRDTLAQNPDLALIAVVHALTIRAFYINEQPATCLDLRLGSNHLSTHAAGIDDGIACRAITARHDNWARQLPRESGALWDFLVGLDPDSRLALLAHCASLSVNAVQVPWERRSLALAHADQLAMALGLDMARYWTATAESYFGRITRRRSLTPSVMAPLQTPPIASPALRNPTWPSRPPIFWSARTGCPAC